MAGFLFLNKLADYLTYQLIKIAASRRLLVNLASKYLNAKIINKLKVMTMFGRKISALLLGAFLCTGLAIAQQQPPSKERRLDFLTQKLNLSDQQVKAIDKILSDSKEQLDQIHGKSREFNKKNMEEIKEVFDKEDVAIEKNLTDSQKKIFVELRKERESHRPPMRPPHSERGDMHQGPPPRGR